MKQILMRNVFLTAGTITFLTTSGFADSWQNPHSKTIENPGDNCCRDQRDYGPYLGLNIGMAQLHSKTQANHDPADGNSKTTEDYFLSDNNIAGSIRLGWDLFTVSKFIFGIEGAAGVSNLKAKDTYILNFIPAVQAKTTLRERYNFGIAGKLAYKINSLSSVYLKLGARFSRFKFSYQDVIDGIGQTIQTTSSLRPGIEPGLGFDIRLDKNWSLNGEYSHTFYKRLILNDADAQNNGLVYHNKPKVGRVMIGLTYHFNQK